jgi:hypothetical protein
VAASYVCFSSRQRTNHMGAYGGNNQVKAHLFATYQMEYDNFTHLSGESIDSMFQRFTVIVNNMRANVTVLPYDDHDRAVKLLQSLDRTCGVPRSRPFWSPISLRRSPWMSCSPSRSPLRWIMV